MTMLNVLCSCFFSFPFFSAMICNVFLLLFFWYRYFAESYNYFCVFIYFDTLHLFPCLFLYFDNYLLLDMIDFIFLISLCIYLIPSSGAILMVVLHHWWSILRIWGFRMFRLQRQHYFVMSSFPKS